VTGRRKQGAKAKRTGGSIEGRSRDTEGGSRAAAGGAGSDTITWATGRGIEGDSVGSKLCKHEYREGANHLTFEPGNDFSTAEMRTRRGEPCPSERSFREETETD